MTTAAIVLRDAQSVSLLVLLASSTALFQIDPALKQRWIDACALVSCANEMKMGKNDLDKRSPVLDQLPLQNELEQRK